MELQSRIAASAILLLISVAAFSYAQDPQGNSPRSAEPLPATGQRADGASSRANFVVADQAWLVADQAWGKMTGGLVSAASAQTTTATSSPSPVLPVANPCPRYSAGSVVHNPPALFSSNGVLDVKFSYQQRMDSDGRQLFCFMTPDGLENPTLHLKPGDRLILTITNNAPDPTIATPGSPIMPMGILNPPNCGDAQPTASSIN